MRRDFIVIAPHESLLGARSIMRLARLRSLPVADDGILLGVLFYRDIQALALKCAGGADGPDSRSLLASLTAREAMREPVPAASPECPAEEAAARMLCAGIAALPIVETEGDRPHLLGLVTESDLIRLAYAS
jgi:CBS domain-containing protein